MRVIYVHIFIDFTGSSLDIFIAGYTDIIIENNENNITLINFIPGY